MRLRLRVTWIQFNDALPLDDMSSAITIRTVGLTGIDRSASVIASGSISPYHESSTVTPNIRSAGAALVGLAAAAARFNPVIRIKSPTEDKIRRIHDKKRFSMAPF